MSDAPASAREPSQAHPRLGAGQVALLAAGTISSRAEQVHHLYALSDPALAEMTLDELLDELLLRVRAALEVDTVAILLLDNEAGQLVARAAKGIEEEVERGVRVPLGQGFAGRIAAERVAIYIADVDHADILNPILREKGIRSLLGVPMIVEGQLIGVMHVGSLKPRRFTEEDVALLELAAARAAPGIDRARLFYALEREHQVAMVLQRSLLPRRLPDIPGVTLSTRYLAARHEVGGDWYDVIELDERRLLLVVGDVSGRGLRAATTMAQLRYAIRAYAAQNDGPAEILTKISRLVSVSESGQLATVLCVTVEREARRLSLTSAGHLPPLLLSNGDSRYVEADVGLPIGVQEGTVYRSTTVTVPPEATVVAFTDGLVETRGESIDQGLERLRVAASGHDVALPELLRRLVSEMANGNSQDDIAIVGVRWTS
jgi:GAF domain-containing protein